MRYCFRLFVGEQDYGEKFSGDFVKVSRIVDYRYEQNSKWPNDSHFWLSLQYIFVEYNMRYGACRTWRRHLANVDENKW